MRFNWILPVYALICTIAVTANCLLCGEVPKPVSPETEHLAMLTLFGDMQGNITGALFRLDAVG